MFQKYQYEMIITMEFVVRQLIIPFLAHILTLQSYYKYMAIFKKQK